MSEPTRVGDRYLLEQRIGAGSMGVVWQAADELLGRQVAVKELLLAPTPTGETDGAEDARARILREARLAARLQHPHTIAVFDVVVHDERPWLVMEYLPSKSLATVLLERDALPPYEVAEIGEQIADGLAAAHTAGIVHRDVKPGNVLIAEDGTVKITDFGVSWAADDVALTRTGLIQGTPAYLAPEVARGQPPTPASDVFSLGATLYTAVEGEPPFGLSENTLAQLHTVAAGKVRPPTLAGPLTAMLMRLLRVDPAERPSAEQARAALAAVAGRGPSPVPAAAAVATVTEPVHVGGTITTTAPLPRLAEDGPAPPADPPSADRPARQRNGIRLAAIALALLVLVGIGTLLVLAVSNPAPQVAAPAGSATPPSPTPTAQPVSDAELESFVTNYYALLPDDVDRAFALLGPTARSKSNGFDGFRRFYAELSAVEVVDGPQALDADTVQATIRFTGQSGNSVDDRYRFTVRPGTDGALQIADFTRV